MNRKTISAVAWAISSCLFLWVFSLAQGNVNSNPPTYNELFESFIVFSLMLLGGGACYHVLTEIVLSPLNSENAELWAKLTKKMLILMTVLLSVPLVILLTRDTLTTALAWVISYFYFLICLGLSLWLLTKIKSTFTVIRSNKPI